MSKKDLFRHRSICKIRGSITIEVMWRGIVKACAILKYPESSAMHRDYFETMFDM